MPEDVMFQEAVQAVRQRQPRRARDLLTRLLRADQANPSYWLWMSAVVDTRKERVYCLQSVLRLDPANEAARQGLRLMGLGPQEEVIPAEVRRRKWSVAVDEVPRQGKLSAAGYLAVGLVVVVLVAAGGFGLSKRRSPAAALLPTQTAGPSPTFTPTPTFVNVKDTPMPPTPRATRTGPPPLWTLLEATYTPTPIYAATPHPASEAFRLAQRALERGDWTAALSNLEQAIDIEPQAADLPYHVGEVYRQQGKESLALEAYEGSIAANPEFAPAYLGRARMRLLQGRTTAAAEDLQAAIDRDPAYGEAYLERAALLLAQGNLEAAWEDLEAAAELLPDSPSLYLHRAEIELARAQDGDEDALESALEDARRANSLDRTLLKSYLLVGQAALRSGETAEAAEALDTYVAYAPKDPAAWAALGLAAYQTEQYEDALEALDRALALDHNLAEASLTRGLARLALGQGQPAVNDLLAARLADSDSFEINLALGRALLLARRLKEARDQLSACEDLAEGDAELAQIYYWRALAQEKIGNGPAASLDWRALLALPAKALPDGWKEEAQEGLARVATPTPTPTATATKKPTATPKPSATPRPSATPKPSITPKASTTPKVPPALKASPTLKATVTPKASATPTPTGVRP